MVPVAVFVAIFALAAAVPVPDGTPSLSVLPGAGPQVGISLLPATIDISSFPSISNLPAVVDESNQVVEIAVEHDETPCAACFKYMSELIEELTSSVSGDISVQRPSLEGQVEVAVLPADVSSDIASINTPAVLPADVSSDVASINTPAVLPADVSSDVASINTPAVLPADVSSDISSVHKPAVLPADVSSDFVSSLVRPVALPADLLQRPETIIR